MQSPTQRVFPTYEPTVKFQGTFDKNFDITFNGKSIKLNDAGNFYYEEKLKVGLNTFVIDNKGVREVYKITRKVKILDKIEPTSGAVIRVEGQTNIDVSVITSYSIHYTKLYEGKGWFFSKQKRFVKNIRNRFFVSIQNRK